MVTGMWKKRRESRKYQTIGMLLLGVMLLSAISVIPVQASKIQEQVEEIRLESVRAEMPEMNIYCYLSDPALAEQVQVSLGEKKLAAEQAVPFQETGEGISYYILLDVSASISAEYFEQIKAAVIQFQQNMQQSDDMTLITFGNEVRVICQNCSRTDNLTEQIQGLENTDETTLLFQAIQKTAELADKREEKRKRKVALVLTDGEDFSQNTATQAEALHTLQEKSIPLYGLAVREMSRGRENPYIDSMGEFTRSSGGILEVFGQEEAAAKMSDMQNLFYQAYEIQAKADSNHVDYTPQPLTVSFQDGTVRTMDVTTVYYREDTKAPGAKVKKLSDKKLEITFSEPVKNGENGANYQITIDEKQPLAVYSVAYDQEKKKAVLSFEKELVNGNYLIEFEHITDNSMEENPLTETCTIEITDGADPQEGQESFWKKNQGLAAGVIVGAAFLLAAVIGIYVVKKRKGLVTVEGKAVLVSNLDKKHHVAVDKKQMDSHMIRFLLEGAPREQGTITAEVAGSLFVGRSQICDIYMDDEKMSKQHFVIYDNGDGFDIEDLQSTNGTKVNGTRIYTRTRLKPGDKIKAGEVLMTVRW